MKSKTIVSGAMIVAAGVSATSDRVSAAGQEPESARLSAENAGLNFDTVKIDDDVLKLGGLAQESGAFGAHGETGGFRADGEELYLAQTLYGGTGGGLLAPGELRVQDATRMTVINPNTNRSMTVLYNSKTRTFFDAKSGERINAPKWLQQQVEK